jgi:large subunit ribosomal protein L20
VEGLSYSKLIGALHKAGIDMNRKVLADLAMNHPEAFKAIVTKAKNG